MPTVCLRALFGASLLAASTSLSAVAQQQQQAPGYEGRLKQGAIFDKTMNLATIGVLTESVGGTSVRITADLAHEFDRHGQVRLLAMVGKGAVQNVADIIYLKGTDVSIVQSDALEYYRKNIWNGVDKSIHYITSMYEDEVHVLARRDVGGLNDLAGKKVNLDLPGSGTQLTGSILFERLGIPIEVVSVDQERALAMLERGEIAAAVMVSGKPVAPLGRVERADNASEFRLLGVPPVPQLLESYRPARLAHDDYPGLIPPDEAVDTISVRSVMAVFNWPANSDRYARVARFIDSFFPGVGNLQAAGYRHAKWREVDIRADVPGWTRLKAADDWLRRHPVAAPRRGDPELARAFEAFLRERAPQLHQQLGDAERAKLFEDFQGWRVGEAKVQAEPAAARDEPVSIEAAEPAR